MKNNKPVTFNDVFKGDGKGLVQRKIEVHREGLEHRSSNTIYFYCPFCDVEVKAYVWSLIGGGKRCNCGALFTGRSGSAFQWEGLVK